MIDRVAGAVALIACAACLLLGIGWSVDSARLKGERDAARLELSEASAALAEQRLKFEVEAREREHVQRIALDRIRAVYEQELSDAQADHDRVAAGLRAGNLRLHDRWQTCAASAGVPVDPAATGSADAAADDRAESAARIVRAAAECDAQVRGLQSVIRAYADGYDGLIEREMGGKP